MEPTKQPDSPNSEQNELNPDTGQQDVQSDAQPQTVEPLVMTPAADQAPVQSVLPSTVPTASTVMSGVDQQSPQTPAANHSNPGVIVLQWLTYAFWGWTAVSVISLAASILGQIIVEADSSTFTIYALAATLVLLPISIVCDVFYSRKEPTKKTGAASLVMIIHAVIFALCGIGSLISMVFAILSLATASGDSTGDNQVWILTSFIAAAVYALLFVRTLLGPKLSLVRRLTPIIMAVFVGVLAVGAFIGPIAGEAKMRQDKLLVSSLTNVAYKIDRYTSNQGALPDSLDQLDLSGDDKSFVDAQKITYTKKEQALSADLPTNRLDIYNTSQFSYSFELCAVYDHDYNTSNIGSRSDHYADSFYVEGHKAGKQCYDLTTGY